MKLHNLGEDRLLNLLLAGLSLGKAVAVGPGDDCALVAIHDRRKLLVLKVDCVVEGVHFLRGTSASDVGWKAMMRPLSDFAATSAVPQFALITMIVPEQTKIAWIKELYRGLRRAARRFDVSIVGGETSSTPGEIAISTSVIGFVEKHRAVSRRGGKPGDDLFVTGRLGGALRQKHLQFIPRIVESRWLTENFSIHAMMDSKINDAISEGEDYELLFAISPRNRNRLEREWKKRFPRLPLTRIGSLSQLSTKDNQLLPRGYVHFQQSG